MVRFIFLKLKLPNSSSVPQLTPVLMKKGLECCLSVPVSHPLNQTSEGAPEKLALSHFQVKSPAAGIQNATADCASSVSKTIFILELCMELIQERAQLIKHL